MTILKDLLPSNKHRIIDLVKDAGVNVNGWSTGRGGDAKAASNPKYCYEWTFLEPNKVLVLNLWFEDIKETDSIISYELNMQRVAKNLAMKPSWRRRASDMDKNIQIALAQNIPIRVVIQDGDKRKDGDENSVSSKVKKRLLDTEPWSIVSYDNTTGNCVLERGAQSERFVDQFEINENVTDDLYFRKGKEYKRSRDVRIFALIRAKGRCEFCNESGFVMGNGNIYLESHHIVPLSEDGEDDAKNVIALCPNHHRQAHHGANKKELKKKFFELINNWRPRQELNL